VVPSRGFLYAATGEKSVREAIVAATQLHRVHPDVPSVLFTDRPDLARSGPFVQVIQVPEQRWVRTEAKVWAVGRSPYEQTVYLDTDTFVCGDMTELFDVLDRFDVAGVPVTLRLAKGAHHADPDDVPDAFQTINGGMLAYRRNDATAALFERWWELYQADRAAAGDDHIMDQPSLRVALWRTDCQLLIVPSEFNMRTKQYRSRPVAAVGRVRMIHGRPRDLHALDRKWNRSDRPRFLTPLFQYQLRLILRRVPRRLVPERVMRATLPLRQRLTGQPGK